MQRLLLRHVLHGRVHGDAGRLRRLLGAVPGRLPRPAPRASAHRWLRAGLLLAHRQVLVPDVRHDVAALDAPPPPRGTAHVCGLEGAAAHRCGPDGGHGRARHGEAHGERILLGQVRRLAAHHRLIRLPLHGNRPGRPVEPATAAGVGGMKQWLTDVWEGFWTVLVGMKITWRHLFVKKPPLYTLPTRGATSTPEHPKKKAAAPAPPAATPPPTPPATPAGA